MILLNKHKQVTKKGLDKKTRFLFLEGPAQTGKSNEAILLFGLRVADSDNELHCIAAKDLDAIRDNILEGENKFLDLFKGLAFIKSPPIGGKYIEFHTSKGIKKILLAGYSNTKTWEKILGKAIEVFLIDEINIAQETFVNETLARQFSFDHPLTIGTLNGDDPEHYVYEHFINYSEDMFPLDTPATTISDMEKVPNKKGYYYAFWGLDDHPTMSPEKKENIMNAYPEGSFYYLTKVLGVRGVQDGALYAHLIKPHHYVDWSQVNLNAIKICEIGIDIGDNAKTIAHLTGYTDGFARVLPIDAIELVGDNHMALIEQFNEWLKGWYPILGFKINGVWPDAAESMFIKTLRQHICYPIMVKPSIKLTIAERTVLKEQLIHQNRMLFVKDFGAIDYAKALRKLKTDGKGGVIDDNKPENDYNDAGDYSMTPHYNKLSNYKG